MMLPPAATVREAPDLLAFVREHLDDAAVVDCALLERCDAAGLQVLIALRDAVNTSEHSIRFTNVPAELQWRFAFAGLPTDPPVVP